jgi:hypothetical protein
MLLFQGEMVVGDLNPTRWVEPAYIALSGRKKKDHGGASPAVNNGVYPMRVVTK